MKDYLNYTGKVCVVTGAASGMGKATTELLVDLGAEVYALDLMEPTTTGIKEFIKVNLGDKDSIDLAFAKLPNEMDCFFGIAGVSGVKTDYITTMTINYIANKYMTEEYLYERMKPGGAVAFIASTAAFSWEKEEHRNALRPIVESKGWEGTLNALKGLNQDHLPGGMAYMVSKRALNYFIATSVSEFAKKKVRINSVMPAATQTGLTKEFEILSGGGLENAIGYSNRLAEAREMAAPIVFLNSDMASFISGTFLNVDYGQYVQIVLGEVPDYGQNPSLVGID